MVFSNKHFTEKTVFFSGIRPQIVGVEGKHAYHLTTSTAQLESFFIKLVTPWIYLSERLSHEAETISSRSLPFSFIDCYIRSLDPFFIQLPPLSTKTTSSPHQENGKIWNCYWVKRELNWIENKPFRQRQRRQWGNAKHRSWINSNDLEDVFFNVPSPVSFSFISAFSNKHYNFYNKYTENMSI